MNVSLSLILPCYNPSSEWLNRIEKNIPLLNSSIQNFELILVNDGSTKGLDKEAVKLLQQKYRFVTFINYFENKGKGFALREGVKSAKGELVIYTDVDFPYTHDGFLKIYTALVEGNDVAVGIRSKNYYTHLPAARINISKILRWFIKSFLRIPTDDTQCGLKGFNQKGKEVFLQTKINRYLFDLEFIFLAAKNKMKIKTVEVELRPEVQLSKMNWKILLTEFGNFLRVFFSQLFS